ncbi:MAG: lytic transglycosylase domain-containing protein [Saprospiraceae bacterium]|nr:lytic transglycosylase domain-containing protein [Saprospiraceae bacterium]
MNRIKYIAMQYKVILIALFLGSALPLQAEGSVVLSDKTIENRIFSLGSSVDVQYNAEVKRRIKQYTVKQRAMSEILLGRSSIYFPLFEKVFETKGLPEDLKYLSVVESGLRPVATSRSGAAGLWQFMRPTGRMMGLKINRTIDERRDIEKSTAAAADYLLYLYERFDDWTLAIAAYNCGPGNLRKAIRKSGGKRSFWEIKKYLPKETREYVPKFIAISYVMKYYYEHDLVPEIPNEDLINTSSAQVFETINLKKLSKELDIELKVMKTLNPSYIRNYIPKSEDGIYNLVLPTTEMRLVAQKYHVLAELPELKEQITEDIAEANTISKRSFITIEKIPSALYLSSDGENPPNQLKPLRAYSVRLGNDEDYLDYRPDAYKIDDKKYSISYLNHIIKGSKKSL